MIQIINYLILEIPKMKIKFIKFVKYAKKFGPQHMLNIMKILLTPMDQFCAMIVKRKVRKIKDQYVSAVNKNFNTII